MEGLVIAGLQKFAYLNKADCHEIESCVPLFAPVGRRLGTSCGVKAIGPLPVGTHRLWLSWDTRGPATTVVECVADPVTAGSCFQVFDVQGHGRLRY